MGPVVVSLAYWNSVTSGSFLSMAALEYGTERFIDLGVRQYRYITDECLDGGE